MPRKANYPVYPRTVWGIFSGNDSNGIFEWECPTTNEWKSMQGEFEWDEQGYFHPVYMDENSTCPTYVVRQKNTSQKVIHTT